MCKITQYHKFKGTAERKSQRIQLDIQILRRYNQEI